MAAAAAAVVAESCWGVEQAAFEGPAALYHTVVQLKGPPAVVQKGTHRGRGVSTCRHAHHDHSGIAHKERAPTLQR
jgi:hypothetical protein